MSIKSQLTESMKSAMRAQNKELLGTIRLILSALKQVEVDKRIDLNSDEADVQVLAILSKMLKQRRDSIEQYTKADRMDLAAREQAEVEVIKSFMPPQLDEAQIKMLLQEAIEQLGATSVKDMGKIMAYLQPKMQGRADLAAVGLQLKDLLAQLG